MRIVLLGDVMLGRLVNRHLAAAAPEYPWGNTLPLLRSADALIANLECVIADRGEPWPGKPFTFRSDLKNVAVLRTARATAVSLANNHSLDYGPEALRDCVAALDRHGIRAAGAGASIEAARRPAEFRAGGTRVAFVAFTDNEPEWEAGSGPGVYYVPVDPRDRRFDRLLATIAEARRTNDFVIVSAHWGPNWGYDPPEEHVTAAHLLIDAGADVVFGHSPHVVRGIEVYRDRPILYSCGNYVDDYAVDEVERNDESFVFCLDYAAGAWQELLLVPTMIENFQARLARGSDARRIVKLMQTLCAGRGTEARPGPGGLTVPAPRPASGVIGPLPDLTSGPQPIARPAARAYGEFDNPRATALEVRPMATSMTMVSRLPRVRTSPALRRVLAPYPRAVELPDGATVVLRPLVARDRDKLVALFIDIPHEELRNLQDNVSDPTVVLRWCRNLNYDRVLPIVAELDGKIVGDATLHRRAVGPMRQIGRFRAYVRPEYRQRGIGAVLLQEILSVARQVGLTQLVVELYEDQTALRKVFARYGFREEGRVPVYQRVILMRDLVEEETSGTAEEEKTVATGEITTGTMLGRNGPRPPEPGAP